MVAEAPVGRYVNVLRIDSHYLSKHLVTHRRRKIKRKIGKIISRHCGWMCRALGWCGKIFGTSGSLITMK